MALPRTSWSYAIAIAILGIGTALSAVLAVETRRGEDARILDSLDRSTEFRFHEFELKLADATVPVEALADFLGTQRAVDPEEFHDFARIAAQGDPVARLYWVPIVPDAARASFEAAARGGDAPDYEIRDSGNGGALTRAARRSEYAPIRFEERFAEVSASQGYDLLGDPDHRTAALQARDTGEPTTTLVRDVTATTGPKSNFSVYWPVYPHAQKPQTVEERQADCLGFAAGFMPIDALMAFVFADAPRGPSTMSVFVGTKQPGAQDVPSFVYRAEPRKVEFGGQPLGEPPEGGLRLSRTLPTLGTTWSIVFDYPAASLAGLSSDTPWAPPAAGFALTLLLAAYVTLQGRQKAMVEAEVEARTRDLNRTTEHLRSTSERMKAVVDTAADGIVLIDAVGIVLSINPAAERMFGYRSDEIVDRNIKMLMPEPYAAEHDGYLDAYRRTGERRIIGIGREAVGRRKDGTIFPMYLSVSEAKQGGETIFAGTVHDLTQTRAADAALRETQALLAAIVSSSDDAMISKTLDGIVTTWNTGAERIFGYAADEMIGAPIARLVTPGDEDDMRMVLDRIKHGERVDHYETQRRHRDGTIIDISLSVSPIRNAAGVIVGASKIARDITAAKRAERDLLVTERKYRTTFDIAPVGITHISPAGRYLMVNDFFCTMLGYSREELLATEALAVTDPAVTEDLRDLLDHLCSGEVKDGKIMTRFLHRSGRTIWCDLTVAASVDEAGQLDYIISIISDISARKAAEDHHLQLASQLQQSQKMEAIGQLTGGMAHDFNNLLSIILGNLDFLEEKFPAGSDEGKLTQAAIKAAIHGAELTRRLLAFSRRQPLAPKHTYLASVIEGAAHLFRRTVGDDVSLEVRLPSDLWPVMIDVSQLESTLLNLVVNARDAMPAGGTIVIEAGNMVLGEAAAELNPEAVPGEYVAISVSDTGTGMPGDVIAKVFDPFFTTKGDKGTGLGLSMVHGFVKQSGGYTRIYSELGRGTAIRIYLPRTAAAEAEEDEVGTPRQPSSGHEIILVVEDNRALQDVAIRRLQELGYRTVPASDGVEALAIIRGGVPFDLLFTDVVMPGGMDGRALAEAARRLRPGLRVLFTSGFTAAGASAAMTQEFGVNLLTKPYRKEDLARMVRQILDGPA